MARGELHWTKWGAQPWPVVLLVLGYLTLVYLVLPAWQRWWPTPNVCEAVGVASANSWLPPSTATPKLRPRERATYQDWVTRCAIAMSPKTAAEDEHPEKKLRSLHAFLSLLVQSKFVKQYKICGDSSKRRLLVHSSDRASREYLFTLCPNGKARNACLRVLLVERFCRNLSQVELEHVCVFDDRIVVVGDDSRTNMDALVSKVCKLCRQEPTGFKFVLEDILEVDTAGIPVTHSHDTLTKIDLFGVLAGGGVCVQARPLEPLKSGRAAEWEKVMYERGLHTELVELQKAIIEAKAAGAGTCIPGASQVQAAMDAEGVENAVVTAQRDGDKQTAEHNRQETKPSASLSAPAVVLTKKQA